MPAEGTDLMKFKLPRLKVRRGISPIDMHPVIGEADAKVFTCPGCSRPLPNGTWRCPGCGAFLVLGVGLQRAAAILGLGAVIGAVLASIILLTLTGALQPATGIAGGTGASGATGASPSAGSSGSPPALPANVPQTAVAALTGTSAINARVVADTAALVKILAKSGDTTAQIARALRSLGADAAQGVDMTGRIAGWTDATELKRQLNTFYSLLADTAQDGTHASFSDRAAYRSAGFKVVSVAKTVAGVDAASRVLAGTVGVVLPSIGLPGAKTATPTKAP